MVLGVHAVADVASITSFNKDPAKVVPATVNATMSILNSCLSQPSVKSFVYTSSSAVVSMPKLNVSCAYDSNTWNEEDIKTAWKPEPWEKGHEWVVYAAGKTDDEKALWKIRDEKRPHFSIKSILPATNFGPVITPDTVSSTAKFVPIIYDRNMNALLGVSPHKSLISRRSIHMLTKWRILHRCPGYERLHVAAVKFPEIQNESL